MWWVWEDECILWYWLTPGSPRQRAIKQMLCCCSSSNWLFPIVAIVCFWFVCVCLQSTCRQVTVVSTVHLTSFTLLKTRSVAPQGCLLWLAAASSQSLSVSRHHDLCSLMQWKVLLSSFTPLKTRSIAPAGTDHHWRQLFYTNVWALWITVCVACMSALYSSVPWNLQYSLTILLLLASENQLKWISAPPSVVPWWKKKRWGQASKISV